MTSWAWEKIMADNIASGCTASVKVLRRYLRVAGVAVLIMMAIVIGSEIKSQQRKAVQNNKTAVVAAQAASITHIASVILSEDGKILLSNTDADNLLNLGKDISGKNIHDFCGESAVQDRARVAMAKWYHNSPEGSVKALAVTINLPAPVGRTEMVVIATTIKKGIAGDIAFIADIIPASQYSYTAINKPRKQSL